MKLFKIYHWIMASDYSSLSLTSALSMNASRDKIRSLLDRRLQEHKKNYKPEKNVQIDKNMTIINDPFMFTVGTSFESHPPYPKLGNRVAYTNNHNPHVSFGKTGTVVGIYKSKIEVVFDEPFIGANDLAGRCDYFRGALVDFHHIFNLTE